MKPNAEIQLPEPGKSNSRKMLSVFSLMAWLLLLPPSPSPCGQNHEPQTLLAFCGCDFRAWKAPGKLSVQLSLGYSRWALSNLSLTTANERGQEEYFPGRKKPLPFPPLTLPVWQDALGLGT